MSDQIGKAFFVPNQESPIELEAALRQTLEIQGAKTKAARLECKYYRELANALLKALKQIEWKMDDLGDVYCPACHRDYPNHHVGCMVGDALKKAEESI